MSVDAIGDFLTIIRNGIMAAKPFVLIPHSTLKLAIVNILKEEGFIHDYQLITDSSVKKTIKVLLKYVDGESVIHEIQRVSKPGRRSYSTIRSIKPIIGGLGVSILSTNRGLLTNKQARQLNVGGEIVCTVW